MGGSYIYGRHVVASFTWGAHIYGGHVVASFTWGGSITWGPHSHGGLISHGGIRSHGEWGCMDACIDNVLYKIDQTLLSTVPEQALNNSSLERSVAVSHCRL